MTTAAPTKPKRARTPKPVIDGEAKPKRTRVAKPKVETYSIGKTKYKKGAAVLWNWPKAQPTKAVIVGQDGSRFLIRYVLAVKTKYGMQEYKYQTAVYPGSLKAVV